MATENKPSAFDASNPKMAELAGMRDELAKEARNLQWKSTGLSMLGAGLGATAGLAGVIATGNVLLAPTLIMGGAAGGSMLGGRAAEMMTVEARTKQDINRQLMEAEMSRINADNWGKYYATPANGRPTAPPVFPQVVATQPQRRAASL